MVNAEEPVPPKTLEPLNLRKAIEIALKTHPTIAGSQYDVKAKEAQLGQARAGYFPSVDIALGFTRNFEINNTKDTYFSSLFQTYNQNTGKATLNQTIYDFGRTPANVDIKKLNVAASRMTLDDSMNTVVNDVKSAYYTLFKARKSLDVNTETVEQYKKHLSQATMFFEAGKKPKYDVIQAEVDLSTAKLDLISARNDLDIAWVTLNTAMGVDSDNRYELEPPSSPAEFEAAVEDALAMAYKNRPDLKSLTAQKEAADRNVELQKKEYFPKFTGTAQYNAAGSQYPLGQGWLAGVAMSVNVFDGLSTTNKVAEAVANAKSMEAKINALKLQILSDVKQSYLGLAKAKEAITVSEIQIKQARENLELANLRYESGLATPVDVTDATVSYSKARLTNIKAVYDYMTAGANMEKAMGSR